MALRRAKAGWGQSVQHQAVIAARHLAVPSDGPRKEPLIHADTGLPLQCPLPDGAGGHVLKSGGGSACQDREGDRASAFF